MSVNLSVRRASASVVVGLLLLSAAATWLWAHEGHLPLPTRGAVFDAATGQLNLSADAQDALDVQTAEATLETLEDRLDVSATLVAPWQRRAFVTARLAGRVAAVLVQPGQAVAKGQALATVQSLELENLQLDLRTASADSALSHKNLEQIRKAFPGGALTGKALRDAEVQHEQDRIALEVARLKLRGLGIDAATVQKLLDDPDARPVAALPVLSPFAGVVTIADAQVGQAVEVNDHLFEVVDLNAVWVKLAVLEQDLPRVAAGQPVALHLPAYPAAVLHCRVQVKGLALDPKTREGTAWAELPNPPGRPPLLLSGMVGRAEIVLSARKAVTVPTTAMVRDGAERFVLIEEGPRQYVRQNVVPGHEARGRIEVRAGQVVPGDRVVTVGSHELASFYSQGTLKVSSEAARTIGLVVAPARKHPVAEILSLGGIVELPPQKRAIATARLGGTIRRVLADRDQAVQAGDVLAEVASLDFQNLQLEMLRQHLQAGLLEKTLAGMRSAGQGAVPDRQLRETEAAHRAAVQKRDSHARKLEAVGLMAARIREVLDKSKLVATLPVRAPIAGVVVRFDAALGHAIKADEPLFEIHDLSRSLIRGFVAEQQLPQVRPDQKVRVYLATDPEHVAEGIVVRSGQAFGVLDHTLSVWAELSEPPPGPWLPGMLVRLALVLADPAPVLAVPLGAILRDGAQTYLFVRHTDGTFERRPVVTGRSDDRFVAVTAGLHEGEAVAVHGAAELQTALAAVK